jgi:endonuclease/exonuclease/phosphatase (EEP) superfamily protein YafD
MPDLDAIAGDFNMPTDSRILRHFWDPHYTNAFSTVGLGLGHTKHTPVGPLTYGLRIDHIFVNHKNSSQNHKKNLPRPENNNAGNAPNFPSKNTPIRSQVAPTVGSDHLPLWADLN